MSTLQQQNLKQQDRIKNLETQLQNHTTPQLEGLLYEDKLIEALQKDFPQDKYVRLFSIRAARYLEKFERMEKLFQEEGPLPEEMNLMLAKIRRDLSSAVKNFRMEDIPPEMFF